jgi:hypothetical protein
MNNRQWQYKTFSNTLVDGELDKSDKNVQEQREVKWSVADRKNRDTIIQIIGYDPFEDYTDENRKFLFNNLIRYFDDDIESDAYKISQIIQIVINNNQIRQYDLVISNLDPTKDANDIKTLNEIKSRLVVSNDKIAKENEISVKNRSNKETGKGTLTMLQRKLRQMNFEEAETSYYDQLRSDGTAWAIEMSDKAIRQHAMFDENDKQEIFNTQRDLVRKLQKELDDALEEKRLLHIQVDELKVQVNSKESGDVE